MIRPESLDENTIDIANISSEFTSLVGRKRSLEFLTLQMEQAFPLEIFRKKGNTFRGTVLIQL